MADTQASHGTSKGYKSGCRCDACVGYRRDYDRARYERLREQRLEQAKAWRAANPDKMRGYSRAQYQRDPALAQDRTRRSLLKNPAARQEADRRYRERNRAALCLKAQLRRSAVHDEWTADYIALLLNDPCSYCGGRAGTVDHIVPLHAGGTNEWHNLTAACKACNSSKSNRDLLGHLARGMEK